jgi:hypothetical protein
MLLKWRASPDMLPFSLYNNTRLEETPLSNDTIDSILRHREVGRAKDISAPPRNKTIEEIIRRDTNVNIKLYAINVGLLMVLNCPY